MILLHLPISPSATPHYAWLQRGLYPRRRRHLKHILALFPLRRCRVRVRVLKQESHLARKLKRRSGGGRCARGTGAEQLLGVYT